MPVGRNVGCCKTRSMEDKDAIVFGQFEPVTKSIYFAADSYTIALRSFFRQWVSFSNIDSSTFVQP